MKNAPDFVMYVVMVENGDKYDPYWCPGDEGLMAYGYHQKSSAKRVARRLNAIHSGNDAYIQQYGPYS